MGYIMSDTFKEVTKSFIEVYKNKRKVNELLVQVVCTYSKEPSCIFDTEEYIHGCQGDCEPVYRVIFILEVLGENYHYELRNDDVLSNPYVWDKGEVMEAVRVSGLNYSNVLLEILEKRLPKTLETY